MKMEKKQCTKCNFFLLLKEFKVNLHTGQLTNCCVKSLDNCKKLRQQTKCKHGRQRSQCKDCGGSQICEQNNQKSKCKGCCGSQICKHNKQKPQCKNCGGSQICGHNKRRSVCLFCGSQIREHNKIKSSCKDCNPFGHFARVAQSRVYIALKNDKEMSSTEYIGCNIETFKKHIEQQFTEGRLWENYSEWHIDHKIPLKCNKPSLEEVAQRLHYKNTQPMWESEIMSKGCRYISE